MLHGGKGNFLAAAAGTVGLGDNGDNLQVRLREEVFESGNGELGCAAEEEAHEISPMKQIDPLRQNGAFWVEQKERPASEGGSYKECGLAHLHP